MNLFADPEMNRSRAGFPGRRLRPRRQRRPLWGVGRRRLFPLLCRTVNEGRAVVVLGSFAFESLFCAASPADSVINEDIRRQTRIPYRTAAPNTHTHAHARCTDRRRVSLLFSSPSPQSPSFPDREINAGYQRRVTNPAGPHPQRIKPSHHTHQLCM